MLSYIGVHNRYRFSRLMLVVTFSFLISIGAFAQGKTDRPVLSKSYSKEVLKDILIPRQSWHPFPTVDERAGWLALPESVRQCHIRRGEQAGQRDWPDLPATLFLEYVRKGNRTNYEKRHFARRAILRDMVIGECMEGKGRFVDKIADAVWSVCEESSWTLPAHIGAQKLGRSLPDTAEPIVALFSAETASLLAWTVYLVGDKLDEVSPFIRWRVEREVDNRVLTPYLQRDFWWMGFGERKRRPNNWNTWCNSNCLAVALILEKDLQRRIEIVSRILVTLDKFITPYPSDGGCDEGSVYWNYAAGSLFDCLELLYSATAGKINVYDETLIRRIGQFIYLTHINEDYFINFADASPQIHIAADTALQYGRRIGDKKLEALGALFCLKAAFWYTVCLRQHRPATPELVQSAAADYRRTRSSASDARCLAGRN